MKNSAFVLILFALGSCLFLASCGGPKILIRHARAAEIEIPANIKSIAIVELGGKRPQDQIYGEIAAAQLQDMLHRSGQYELIERSRLRGILAEQDLAAAGITSAEGAAQAGKVANVDAVIFGTVHVQVNDERGTRQEVCGVDGAGNPQYRTVPTLVRSVSASVNVAMVDTTTAKVYATRSATTAFCSSRDRLPGKRSWTQAFARADDPAHVPPADQIINYLLGKAVEQFYNSICCHYAVYEVELAGVKSDAAKMGNEYAEAGNFAEAANCFQQGMVAEPEDHGVIYNLGLMKEASGDLEGALEAYQQAIKVKGKADKKYMQAEMRVKQEIQIREQQGNP